MLTHRQQFCYSRRVNHQQTLEKYLVKQLASIRQTEAFSSRRKNTAEVLNMQITSKICILRNKLFEDCDDLSLVGSDSLTLFVYTTMLCFLSVQSLSQKVRSAPFCEILFQFSVQKSRNYHMENILQLNRICYSSQLVSNRNLIKQVAQATS